MTAFFWLVSLVVLHFSLILCPVATENFCGTDWSDATKCGKPCQSGLDSECPPGNTCFGSVTCGGPSHVPDRAECGLGLECPLRACCSVFGYCGWTSDFCNESCQSNCDLEVPPGRCDNTAPRVRWGYYAAWASTRSCRPVVPADLQSATQKYTHLAFSFAHVGENFEIQPAEQADIVRYREFNELKRHNPAVQTVIAVGGWAFNDPPTQHRFSNMVATEESRRVFIDSVITFLHEFRFDGIDLDWEYPGAEDRGGRSEDVSNYVTLVREMREEFDALPGHFTITMAVPLSNWYLRHFDLANLSKYLDFFNVMSYDLHGVWDGSIPSLGPYVRAHTNMTEIRQNMQMFFKNDVPTSKLVLGLGGYGRAWTLQETACSRPGCEFKGAGVGGVCTQAAGFLSYFEIRDMVNQGAGDNMFDEESGSMYVVKGDQWISYDNSDTFRIKKEYASEKCLRGTMVWSVDMIDGTDVHGTQTVDNGGNIGQGDDGDGGDSGEGQGGDDDNLNTDNGNGDDNNDNDGDGDDRNNEDGDGDDDDDDDGGGDDDDDDGDDDDDDDEPPRGCDCRNPYPDKNGALCYPRCEKGWTGAGPQCHKNCPEGFHDIGLFCQKPKAYGRGAGYAWQYGDPAFENDGQMERCEEDHGVRNCEQNGLLVYPKCKEGYWAIGCCLCTPECPWGLEDTGTGCAKPRAKNRGVGKVLPCVKDFFEKDLKCIAEAILETVQLFDLDSEFEKIKGDDKEFEKGACKALHVFSAASPLLFLRRLLENCKSEAGFSAYGGFGVEGGFGIAAGGAFGVGVGDKDSRACFAAGCGGIGVNVGASVNAIIGVLISGNMKDLSGASIALDQDVVPVAGLGWTFYIGVPSGIGALELAVGIGKHINLGSVKGCYADVTSYMDD